MKVVFSFWSYKNSIDESFLGMAKISNFFAQKNGYETILFCGEEDKDKFNNIPYNEIRILDKKLMSSFHKEMWSMSKIVAMTLMDEPYIMIDFDLLIFKKLDEKNIVDISFFHKESWVLNLAELKNQWLLKIKPKPIKKDNDICIYNCAIIAVKNVSLIKECATYLINHFQNLKYKQLDFLFTEVNFKKWNKNKPTLFWLPIWVIEQIWFPQIIKEKNGKMDVFYDIKNPLTLDPLIHGHYHAWGAKEDSSMIFRDFAEVLNYNINYEDINFKFENLEQIDKEIS
jgi:hypothetical protein